MDPERRERLRAAMSDPKVLADVADAPPPPAAAIALLKAGGFPLFRRSEQTKDAA